MQKFKKRLPSGRNVIRFKRVKPGFARCAKCGKILHGIPRLHSAEMRKLAKNQKKVERAFGGHYCSACTKEFFREKVRNL